MGQPDNRISTGRIGRREKQVLEYVHASIAEAGTAPSYAMICRHLGIATRQEVLRIVARLESKRQLRRVGAGKVRRIRLNA